jgi:hypothetical protein
VIYGPTGFPADVDPLTGIQVSEVENLERRPLAIKVQIFPRNQRPAWGVSQADIVYDYYQNTGLTRFHALFLGQNAEIVGPIRSARLLDIELVEMYKSIMAFGGAEVRTRNRLYSQEFASRLVTEGSSNCPPLCRVDPSGFNYLVADTQELSNLADTKGIPNERQNLDGMSFNSVTPADGQSGIQVYARYSISAYLRWDFDPSTGRYLRFQDAQEANDLQSEAYAPFLDRTTEQQVAADNVVVIFVPHQYAFNSRPGANEVMEILLSGSGPAYAYRDGLVYQVNWNRPATDSVLFLTFQDGTAYSFKPGTTWIEVLGQSSKTESLPDGVWRFEMRIP